MKIYWFRTQAPRRVLALLKHLGQSAELIELDVMHGALQSPEYTRLNPNRRAPTLVDGDRVIWESSAIMAYLSIRAGSDMWPADRPDEQVEVLRWLSWNDHHWAPPTGAFYFEHIVKPMLGLGPVDPQELAAQRAPLLRHAAVLDGALAGHAHICCGRLTIADFQLASMAHYWRESQMPLGDFPNVVAWLDGLARLPAWADPWPHASAPS